MDPAVPDAPPERRLHPWSWLFVLLQQLRQFIVPLVALLVFGGSSDRGGMWMTFGPLLAVGVLVLLSLLQYFTYRYRVGRDGLTIREGWLHRSLREIPFSRIHNVVLHQSLLHRMFGVAEVRLESAGGQKPEAQMRVLDMEQALALENLVRHRGQTPEAAPELAQAQADELFSLPTAEVIRLGLVSNRGMIVMAAAVGLASQLVPDRLIANMVEQSGRQAYGYASGLHLGWLSGAAAGVTLLLIALLLLRGLSVLLALVKYHGFRLSEEERRLTVQRGLFSKLRTSVTRRRIQAWTLQESFLHRVLKRRSLGIDTAVSQQAQGDDRALKELAPIATPQQCEALIQHLLPHAHWPRESWIGLPVRAWWRLFLPTALFMPLLAGVLLLYSGEAWALLPLLWLPWAAYSARQQARRHGYSVDDQLVAVRGGWWSRYWRFAELDKLQALRLARSPLDRRLGTASLHLDTAGANGLLPPLQIRFLPLADAELLYRQLAAALARRRLR